MFAHPHDFIHESSTVFGLSSLLSMVPLFSLFLSHFSSCVLRLLHSYPRALAETCISRMTSTLSVCYLLLVSGHNSQRNQEIYICFLKAVYHILVVFKSIWNTALLFVRHNSLFACRLHLKIYTKILMQICVHVIWNTNFFSCGFVQFLYLVTVAMSQAECKMAVIACSWLS